MKPALRFACVFMLAWPCIAGLAQNAVSIEALTEEQAALIAEQAAVLDAAPRLEIGANAFEPAQMAAGFIAWIAGGRRGSYLIWNSGGFSANAFRRLNSSKRILLLPSG